MEKLLLTTAVGLERYVLGEVASLGYKGRIIRKGRVESWGRVPLFNYRLRTVERVIELLAVEEGVSSLGDVLSVVSSIDWDEYIPLERSFAVRSERIGSHGFTSLNVERESGAVIVQWFLERCGRRPPVDLSDPWVTVRVDVDEDVVFVGLDTTGGKALHRRGWRVYHHPASLNTTIASAMIMESSWRDVLVDPMAGGGTIPIEAELGRRQIPHFLFRSFAFERWGRWNVWRWRRRLRSRIRWTTDEVYGFDRFGKHVKGCGLNARSAGVRIRCFRWDATRLEDLPFTPTHIVTNPPYGLRVANPRVVEELYARFSASAREAGAEEIILLTSRWKNALSYLEDEGYHVEVVGSILYGKLPVKVLAAYL